MATQTTCGEWQLPEFYMNAGETKNLRLPIYNNSNRLISVLDMTGRLSVSEYVNRGSRLFYVDCETRYDSQCGGYVFVAALQPEHTIDLCGKYIYQLSARDQEGAWGVLRGIVTIGHNADKEAIQ